MKYKNIDTQRRLIAVNRVKRWVQPNEVLDLSSIDVRMLGPNGAHVRQVDQTTPLGLPEAIKKAPVAQPTAAPVKKEEPSPAPKKKSATKKPKKKAEPTAAELKEQRAELKEYLEEMNKGELYSFGEDNLDIDLKYKDKKETMVKKVLNAAKKVGYKKIIRKAK